MYLNVQIYQEQNCKNDYDCYLRHIYFQSATVYESHYIPSYYVSMAEYEPHNSYNRL
jgi:hypothetical protein